MPRSSAPTATSRTWNGATTCSRASKTPPPCCSTTRRGSRPCSAASSWRCSSAPSSNTKSAPACAAPRWTTSRSTPSSATARRHQPSGSWRSSPPSPATNSTATAPSSRPSSPSSPPSNSRSSTSSACSTAPTRSRRNQRDNPCEMCGTSVQARPARALRHPEDVDGAVLVKVLRVRPARLLGDQLGALLLERVRDVLEEDQTEDHVLVLASVHVVAQGVGHLPELGLVADRCAVRARRLGGPAALRHTLPLSTHTHAGTGCTWPDPRAAPSRRRWQSIRARRSNDLTGSGFTYVALSTGDLGSARIPGAVSYTHLRAHETRHD